MPRIGLAAACIAALTWSCRPAPAPPAAPAAAEKLEIAWHAGDVDSAFAKAKAENKPVFLYWGAVWCPPCNQIKATVFKSREFVEASRAFVAVELDGDTESAQRWGETFGVQTYPAMIVLGPDRRELLRLPPGVDGEAVKNLLAAALDVMSPMSDVVGRTLRAAEPKLSDWRLLAYHSWAQDDGATLPKAELEPTLRQLAEKAPPTEPALRARLYAHWLTVALAAPLAPERQQEAVSRLREILADPLLPLALADILPRLAGPAVEACTAAGSAARKELTEAWLAAMERAWSRTSSSREDRLLSLMPAIRLPQLEGQLSAEARQKIVARVTEIERSTTDPYERIAIVNTAGHLLEDVGAPAAAHDLLTAEIGRSKTPYYFMSSLGDLEAGAGHAAAALDWHRKAWDSSKGAATRFQWGVQFIQAATELAPTDAVTIETAALAMLDEVLVLPDAFYGRNARRLGLLAGALAAWNTHGDHADSLNKVRDRVRAACPSAEGTARERCQSFLAADDKPAAT